MECALVVLTFLMIVKITTSIKCYHCSAEETYKGELLCKHFNGTETFLVDCNGSTMCYKKETRMEIGNKIRTSVSRGCAPQTFSGDQAKVDGKWKAVTTIYEPYEEACKEDQSDPDRVTVILRCFCRGGYCNSSNTIVLSPILILLVLVSLAR